MLDSLLKMVDVGFTAIGLEHSVANMFILPAALLLKVPLTLGDVVFRNILPVLVGNAIAGSFIVAASYSYQFGNLGKKSRNVFISNLISQEARKKQEKENPLHPPLNGVKKAKEINVSLQNEFWLIEAFRC
jgi:hypothetical protein